MICENLRSSASKGLTFDNRATINVNSRDSWPLKFQAGSYERFDTTPEQYSLRVVPAWKLPPVPRLLIHVTPYTFSDFDLF
jgi:hypothetical protein